MKMKYKDVTKNYGKMTVQIQAFTEKLNEWGVVDGVDDFSASDESINKLSSAIQVLKKYVDDTVVTNN